MIDAACGLFLKAGFCRRNELDTITATYVSAIFQKNDLWLDIYFEVPDQSVFAYISGEDGLAAGRRGDTSRSIPVDYNHMSKINPFLSRHFEKTPSDRNVGERVQYIASLIFSSATLLENKSALFRRMQN